MKKCVNGEILEMTDEEIAEYEQHMKDGETNNE